MELDKIVVLVLIGISAIALVYLQRRSKQKE